MTFSVILLIVLFWDMPDGNGKKKNKKVLTNKK